MGRYFGREPRYSQQEAEAQAQQAIDAAVNKGRPPAAEWKPLDSRAAEIDRELATRPRLDVLPEALPSRRPPVIKPILRPQASPPVPPPPAAQRPAPAKRAAKAATPAKGATRAVAAKKPAAAKRPPPTKKRPG